MDEIYRIGLEIVRQVQASGAAFDTPMQIFTMLGQSEFYFALLPLIFWCVSREVGANLTLLLLTSSYFNGLFKGTFQGPRPYWLDASVLKATSDSFGFPSGHAQAVATVWGYLALRLRRWWGWVAALFMNEKRAYRSGWAQFVGALGAAILAMVLFVPGILIALLSIDIRMIYLIPVFVVAMLGFLVPPFEIQFAGAAN